MFQEQRGEAGSGRNPEIGSTRGQVEIGSARGQVEIESARG